MLLSVDDTVGYPGFIVACCQSEPLPVLGVSFHCHFCGLSFNTRGMCEPTLSSFVKQISEFVSNTNNLNDCLPASQSDF